MSRALRTSVAPFLLLVTPAAIFLRHNGHGFSQPDVLLFVAALAGIAIALGAVAAGSRVLEVLVIAGLMALFADIQVEEAGEKRLLLAFAGLCVLLWLLRGHAARIVSVGMATVLALSFLPQGSGGDAAANAPSDGGRDATLPLFLHLVLDEHIGLEGLPAEPEAEGVRRSLASFFTGNGFRLYGRAYSEYASTVASLGHLVNLAYGPHQRDLAAPAGAGTTFRLTRSAYFDRLIRQGYAVRVYQSEYLDLCAGARVASCWTYRPNSLEALDRLDASAREKLPVIAGAILARSELHTRAKRVYRRTRAALAGAGLPLPDWDWERFAPASLGTMPAFETLVRDVSGARGGTMIFAHLLLPHDPYVYTRECRPRPPRDWVTRGDATRAIVPGGVATPQSRASRYRLYFDQMICTQRKVAQVLAAVPAGLRAGAIVIVQGDHGSRIGAREPAVSGAAALTTADYADHFSTLFAVRAPAIPPGQDATPAPIGCLLRSLVDGNFRMTDAVGECSRTQQVYLEASPAPEARPLPAFWAAAANR